MSRYVVAVAKGDDKFALLTEAVDKSGFFEVLAGELSRSGKTKGDFLVVIKPNVMMFTHKEDPPVTYTDPALVERLIEMIQRAGYKNIRMVEAQNIYGNWYDNRTVKNIFAAAGFDPQKHGYEVCDLTEEAEEHDYGGKLGKHLVGRAWRDADFRISFAKNKTHMSNMVTLALKNIYGTLPMQDKAAEYHAKREWYDATIDNLRNFPVHFGLIDAVYSADGLLGFKGTAVPKHTKMVLASVSIVAVDMVATEMMGVNPERSVLTKLAIEEWGRPQIDLVGIEPGYRHPNWDNLLIKDWFARFVFKLVKRITGRRLEVPDVLRRSYLYHLLQEKVPEFWQATSDVLEESYLSFNISGIISNGLVGDKMDTHLFPRKKNLPKRLIDKSIEISAEVGKNKRSTRRFLRELYENLFSKQ
jgi:uncharacterized protein (DUF362 family)